AVLLADSRRRLLVRQDGEKQPVRRRPHQGFVPALQPAKHQCRRPGLSRKGRRKQVLHGPLPSPCSLYVLLWKNASAKSKNEMASPAGLVRSNHRDPDAESDG